MQSKNTGDFKEFKIDPWSFTSIPIEMYSDETKLSHGTAFFYKKKNKTYLITNFHNLSGINPNNGKLLDPSGRTPTKITFSVCKNNTESLLCSIEEKECKLYEENNRLWVSNKNEKIDIALLEVDIPKDCFVSPINEMVQCEDMHIGIGMDVFVLGFPQKMYTQQIPIWKRASIASEYSMSIDDMPKLLIDAATYKGMSGAPVIMRSNGSYRTNDGNAAMIFGSPSFPTKFLGIYSGRYLLEDDDNKPHQAQLGIVWKKELIEEMLLCS